MSVALWAAACADDDQASSLGTPDAMPQQEGAGARGGSGESTGDAGSQPDAAFHESDLGADGSEPPSPCGACPPGAPVCDEESRGCVTCLQDQDCADHGLGRFCRDRQCVECLSSADCPDPGAAHCDETVHLCVGCLSPEDCQGAMDGDRMAAVCDRSDRRCVECTGTDYAACGLHDDGVTPLVCDSQARRCTDKRAGAEVVCGECVADAECAPGMRCMAEVFAGQVLGHVCLWTIGESDSRYASCTLSDVRPYSSRLRQRESIDGHEVDVCGLTRTTCLALGQFVVEGCEPGDGSACGEPGLSDALCRPRDPDDDDTTFRCTVPCTVSEDCPVGHACNREAARHCDLIPDTCYTAADCGPGQTCDERRCVP